MLKSNRRLITIEAIAATILVVLFGVPTLIAFRLERLGLNPFWMFLSPHYAYIAARHRQEIEWEGIRIRVGPQFVIDPEGGTIRIGRMNSASPLFFDPAMTFRVDRDSGAVKFERSKKTCVEGTNPTDSCTIHEGVGATGNVVCIEHRSHQHPEQFNFWHCSNQNGLDAIYFGSPEQCVEEGRIVVDAFESAESKRR